MIQYFYDALGQVIRENNQRENITVIYDYDFGGNILSKKTYGYTTGSVDGLTPTDTDIYEYENTNWKDQLTSFNGLTMTYDEIGNIKTYNGNTFNWDKGRQLSSITSAGPTISYTYNDSGIRTSKTVGSTTTSYHLNGDKVTYEKTGNVYSYYTYDSNGQLISINYNGTEYTYIRNGQNDIIGLVDGLGVLVVSYTYSTYGEVVSTTGSLASTLGIANPYRYRGYRFDTETGYYYLQSRYYDPQIGRFINADGSLNTSQGFTGINMYIYCANDPVNKSDPSGRFWKEIVDFGQNIVKLVGQALAVVTAVVTIPATVLKIAVVSSVSCALGKVTMDQVYEDIKNYDFFNTDEGKVYKANLFSSYYGTPTFNTTFIDESFSIGNTIVLGNDANLFTVKHEWGHTVQEAILGPIFYSVKIATPSLISSHIKMNSKDYFSKPWERSAEFFGNARSSYSYSQFSDVNAAIYFVFP